MATFDTGPYVQTACFCDQVLTEADGTVSLIRVIDRINIRSEGSDPPKGLPPGRLTTKAVITLKSGMARGSFPLLLSLEEPSGQSRTVAELAVELRGEEHGAAVVADLNVEVTSPGLFWLDVRFGEQQALLTRMPLRVTYGWVKQTGSGPS
jgi:hypothetical protein